MGHKVVTIMVGKLFLLSLMLIAHVGCSQTAVNPPLTTESIPVTRTITESVAQPTAVSCTPLPERLIFSVAAVSETAVDVLVEGLVPNEPITLLYKAVDSTNGTTEIEIQPYNIGANGRWQDQQTLRQDSTGPATWDVQLIYNEGAACTTVTLTP